MKAMLPWDGRPFNGAKIALLLDDQLITYRRDDRPDIPYPNCWDLPGGGREGTESPIECALREVDEEFALRLSGDLVHWQKAYAGTSPASLPGYFLAAHIDKHIIEQIRFGSEGQYWQMMSVTEFLMREDAADFLKARLRDYLDSIA